MFKKLILALYNFAKAEIPTVLTIFIHTDYTLKIWYTWKMSRAVDNGNNMKTNSYFYRWKCLWNWKWWTRGRRGIGGMCKRYLWRSCDRASLIYLSSTTNEMQRYTIFFITVKDLHVSGSFSVHHQEPMNCIHSIWYVPGLAHTRCCEYSSWAPDDGRRNRQKHVGHWL
jgi:hypothetical protein